MAAVPFGATGFLAAALLLMAGIRLLSPGRLARAAGGLALGEVRLIVGGDIVDRLLRQAAQALAQTRHEHLAAHCAPPRMSFTAWEKAVHSAF